MIFWKEDDKNHIHNLGRKNETKAGFVFERHGSNHDIYRRGMEKEEVPRHNEIDERLAKAIIKRRNLWKKNTVIKSNYDQD